MSERQHRVTTTTCEKSIEEMRLPSIVYHLTEEANLKSIEEKGLLSATRLMGVAGLAKADRRRLEREQRRAHTELPSGTQIRDQRPMPPRALEGCLVGLTPADWYALVNARVFFWLDPDRLNRQRAACEPRAQVVLAVDTTRLIAVYSEQLEVTPINTGNARRKPAVRGAATFVPYATWLKSGWASEAKALGTPLRRRSHQPVEITVRDAVPDIMRLVIGKFRLPHHGKFMPAACASPVKVFQHGGEETGRCSL
jgi:hypothetical protein